jgi:hypothetical protein
MLKRVAGLMKVAAYVGVPAAKSSRKGEINNAELLFIFEHGSPIHKQPARPLLKPAINADGNKQKIAAEINGSIRLSLAGDSEGSKKKMLRAALAGQTAARSWFTDSRNGWQPNAASTIARKLGKLSKKKRTAAYAQIDAQEGDTTGVVTVGVDTGQMRAAIVGVVREE